MAPALPGTRPLVRTRSPLGSWRTVAARPFRAMRRLVFRTLSLSLCLQMSFRQVARQTRSPYLRTRSTTRPLKIPQRWMPQVRPLPALLGLRVSTASARLASPRARTPARASLRAHPCTRIPDARTCAHPYARIPDARTRAHPCARIPDARARAHCALPLVGLRRALMTRRPCVLRLCLQLLR